VPVVGATCRGTVDDPSHLVNSDARQVAAGARARDATRSPPGSIRNYCKVTLSRPGDLLSFPVDPAIPALKAFEAQGVVSVLAAAGVSEASGVEFLQHHPGRRCVFAVWAKGRHVVVKVFSASEDPGLQARLYELLEARGLASGRPPTVPAPAGYAPGHLLIANEWLAGPSGSDLIDEGRANLAAQLAATWLRASAGIRADFLPVCDLGQLLADAERHARALAGADAALGAEAGGCLDALRSRSPRGGAPTLRHGSYYGRHVLDVGGGPGVLDWDAACQGPIELDAGDWLAWFERHARRTQPPERVKEAAAIFRHGIADLVEDEALRWFRARSLLKQAEYFVRKMPSGWRDRAAALLAEAQNIDA